MSRLRPFQHQKEAFDIIVRQRAALYLIAGTASGKTLAVALPLFHLLKTGEIKRVLFMYPTLALLDDQYGVMSRLADITGVDVAHIRGGMKRQEILHALNKQVILATPDAIYWFFRKNIKYSSLLIYGLAQVDAFVLDEAHLFNGLSLRNLKHLKERIQALASTLGHSPAWHVLTATPHHELYALTTSGIEVRGKSKCGAVGLTLLEPQEDITRGRAAMVEAVDDAVSAGARKILLVFNSAAAAHSTFDRYTSGNAPLSPALQRQFGRVRWGKMWQWLQDMGVEETTQRDISNAFYSEVEVPLVDLVAAGSIRIRGTTLMAALTRIIQEQTELLLSILKSSNQTEWAKQVQKELGQGGIAARIWRLLVKSQCDSSEKCIYQVEQWIYERITYLEELWSDDVNITTPNAPELVDHLEEAGFSLAIAQAIHKQLLRLVSVNGRALQQWNQIPDSLYHRPVSLDWMMDQINDLDELAYCRDDLLADPQALKELEISIDYVRLWRKTDIPVILYSGKMPKWERKGLIRIFDALPRAILISTSAIEVGVDFDADLLVTEECPGPDLLQRFGRVGRREDTPGQVKLQVHNHSAFSRLRQQLDENPNPSREEFGRIINTIFPPRQYLSGSTFLDATHWLINEQLGHIGNRLNRQMFDGSVEQLAGQIRAAGLDFAFGLRGTMPQLSLRNGVTVDPFYGLKKIPNEKLTPSDSPFEVAKADIYYSSFIYQQSEWDIGVDWRKTLARSQALFFFYKDEWHMCAGPAIADIYFETLRDSRFERLLEQQLDFIEVLSEAPPGHPLVRIRQALPLHGTNRKNLVLGYGDVYMKRWHRRDGISVEITDNLGNPVRLQAQAWLIIAGDKAQNLRQLKEMGFYDIEELIIDEIDTNLVVLEAIVGACFSLYRSWPDAV